MARVTTTTLPGRFGEQLTGIIDDNSARTLGYCLIRRIAQHREALSADEQQFAELLNKIPADLARELTREAEARRR
jgi:hypothetical protein